MLAGEHTPAADMMSNQAAQPTPKDSSAAACDNTREKFRLGDTPEDILRLVLSELLATSPNAVLNLARSSKTLHHAALPFVYRSVVLDRQGSNKRRSYQALITKFRSDGDRGLARHVRRLTVQDDIPPEDLMLILNKIDQCGKLYEFDWNTSTHIPQAVFEKIHATWPHLKISVSVVDRQSARKSANRRMDLRLLSSPLLAHLTYEVYNQGNQPDQLSRSDWPKLTQSLAAGGNIQTLKIRNQPDGFGVVADTEQEKLPRLELTPNMRLPRLEELSIQSQHYWGGSSYLWNEEHCHMLRDTIDCARLHTLDFGLENPVEFFSSFVGVLPHVKSLQFGALTGLLEPAVRFMESLAALEKLNIAGAENGIDELFPAIAMHKNSLKTLILGPTWSDYSHPRYMVKRYLEDVADTFVKLEHIGWDIPCKKSIDPEYLAILTTMRLKKLDVYLHIPGEASDFSDKLVQDVMGSIEPPRLNKKSSIAAAISIADEISERQNLPLEWLGLHISRTGYYDRCQSYLMHAALQLRRIDGPIDADGGSYEVRGKTDWDDLFPLEEDLLSVSNGRL